MKNIILIFSFVLITIHSFTQDFTGKIIYEMDYELPELMEPQRAMLPTEMTTYIGKEHSKVVQNTMLGEQVTIVNFKTSITTSMMDMMGQKIAIEIKPEDASPDNKPSIEYTEETKTIAGYACKKAIYTINSAAGMKKGTGEDTEPISMEVYYTPEISAQSNQQFKELKGLPLEYSVSTQGMVMNIKAKSIKNEKCPKSLFDIPSDYKIMSLEEFQKMMGQ